ncbi:hypothetical protein HRbin39_01777 [bacterium HR39]|nr:hypothetical protein HRbin39_01777 [bacterium HR39]
MPHTLWTDPEVFAVGEIDAEDGGGRQRVRLPYAESDRACAEDAMEGFVELCVDRRRRLRGIAAVGPRAIEFGAQLLPALGRRDALARIAATTMPYPSFAELPRRAAAAVFEDLVFGPWVRGWVKLRRLWR